MFVQTATKALYGYEGEWPCMLPSVMLRGNDSALLSTRKLVLEHVGMVVRSGFGVQSSDEDAAVLVLCFTLSIAEKLEAVRRFRLRVPRGRILILGEGIDDLQSEACEVLATYPGPEIFGQKVSLLASASLSN